VAHGRPPSPVPGGGPSPARHVGLGDLPPAVADRLRFESAAPRRLRSDKIPPEVRAELADVWDGIVADVYDELAGVRRTRALSKKSVLRVLNRVWERLRQAERTLVVTAVYWPLPGDGDWKHLATAGVGGGAAAAAEELAAYGSFGAGASVAVTSAIVGELFEIHTIKGRGAAMGERRRGRVGDDHLGAQVEVGGGSPPARGGYGAPPSVRRARRIPFTPSATRSDRGQCQQDPCRPARRRPRP